MFSVFFIFIVLAHGLIHFIGFAQAYGYTHFREITTTIPKQLGQVWLATGVLFIAAILFYLFKLDAWFTISIVSVIISQALFVTVWKDAKFGTITNIIILIAAIIGYANSRI
ncbi:MAG: hypothetical protein ABIR18_16295 [Chitinophagaceae bacterium]